MVEVLVGCCGFPMARAVYFARFPVVEVQQTFYEPPRAATLERWRAEAPADFRFTLKAWQLITHEPSSPTYRRLRRSPPADARSRYGAFRPTREVRAAWRATLESAQALAASAIVFQCPASFSPTPRNIENLRAFFSEIRHDARPYLLCWEPRGDWPRATVAALCRELGLIPVIDPLARRPFPGTPRYFRLHGIGGYRYRYDDEDLTRLGSFCRRTTYCLFNNIAMAEDAARFAALLRAGQTIRTAR